MEGPIRHKRHSGCVFLPLLVRSQRRCSYLPGKLAERINLLARTGFRSFDITRVSFNNEIIIIKTKTKQKKQHRKHLLCPNFFSLFLSDFAIFRKEKTYIAGIRLHIFWGIWRNYVLEAIQTRTVSNFGAFYYVLSKRRAVQRTWICPN